MHILITYAHTYYLSVDYFTQFHDLFESITMDDKKKAETYRDILGQQALREQVVSNSETLIMNNEHSQAG